MPRQPLPAAGPHRRGGGGWEQSRRIKPSFGLVHRNLAVAYARKPGRMAEAIASMESAIRIEPKEPRYRLELDQLRESAGALPAQRLARLEAAHDVVSMRDDSLAREIALLVEVGRHDRALELLRGRQFHVWEGAGRTAVHNSFAEAHLELGHRHLATGRAAQAADEYSAALECPENLGTGRPFRGGRLSETYYYLGLVQEAVGDQQAARRSFEMAVEKSPATLMAPQRPAATGEPEMFYYAARALEKCGRFEEARRVYQGLVDAAHAQLADHVPMFFFASFGHPQSEKAQFAQARYGIGLGLVGAGKNAEARRQFEEALKSNPLHSGAARRIRK